MVVWPHGAQRRVGLAPFVSRDVDVLGDRETLQALGVAAGAKPQFFPVRPPTNEIGVVIAKDPDGLPLLIEVLRYVHGVSNEELRDPVYTMAVGEPKFRFRAPSRSCRLRSRMCRNTSPKREG